MTQKTNKYKLEEINHKFEPSKDEVSFLYKRMKGLVLVQRKKDCLDLPDKIYRTIKIEPDQSILQIAKTIVASSSTVIGGLTLLRELSDGFQYFNEECGTEICPVCNGEKKIPNPMLNADIPRDCQPEDFENQLKEVDCDGCGGTGERKKYKRIIKKFGSPKDDILKNQLDIHREIGRIVIYGAFTGTIDRIIDICNDLKWEWIRVDGRGWLMSKGLNIDYKPLDIFQNKLDLYPNVAFIGQPDAAGMGLTLTSSPTIVYYSNTFNAESRQQSEDRIHRPGLDINRGATIIDIIHLATDQLILDNLQKKRKLQSLTLGEVKEVFK